MAKALFTIDYSGFDFIQFIAGKVTLVNKLGEVYGYLSSL